MFGKKKMGLILSGVLSLSLLAGCGTGGNAATATGEAKDTKAGAATGTTEISLYTGGSLNVKELWETLIKDFEAKNDHVKVKLVYLPAGTGGASTLDRLIAAKKSGQTDTDIDLYEGSLDDITKGVGEKLWETVDNAKVPNLANVDETYLKQVNNQAIPYRASSVVLAYNSAKVATPPKTADELYTWIRQHPGKFAYNDPSTGGSGSSFVNTVIYNFLPPEAMNSDDPTNMKKWDQGFSLLKELGPSMYQKGVYPKKNQGTLDILASGEVDMVPAWSDMALEQLAKGLLPDTVKLTQIDPAFTGGPSYLMVPSLSSKKEATQEFLNYVLTPEAQTVVINKMYGYPGIKWNLMPSELQEKFNSVSSGYRSFNSGELQQEIYKRWQSEVAGG
ncbi:extracellular solute-binding protein [Paenibacillus terrae]|uniref:Extracellular solute-binding protein family 1 n=1 Tax=Paenibacillus terrae (strain HPL-003) TaxID=985665 RepID=G7VU13_PAETH|nr:extracellular solute-binding protein [Paenibacillus terrae]AET58223.1 extracellular solute-binding protein family 1 [Paenibacillus terrae HPL-003]